jgi:hypothetical protein
MVSRLHPLRIEASFPSRPYHLGDTVPVAAKLIADAHTVIRHGVAEVLCEEHYVERYEVDVPLHEGTQALRPSVLHEIVVKPHTDHYLQGSAIIAEDLELRPGESREFHVDLRIEEEPPPNIEISSTTWHVAFRFDIAMARDLAVRMPIDIVV